MPDKVGSVIYADDDACNIAVSYAFMIVLRVCRQHRSPDPSRPKYFPASIYDGASDYLLKVLMSTALEADSVGLK